MSTRTEEVSAALAVLPKLDDPYESPFPLQKPGPPIVLRFVKIIDGVKLRYTWRGWEPMYGPHSLEEIAELS